MLKVSEKRQSTFNNLKGVQNVLDQESRGKPQKNFKQGNGLTRSGGCYMEDGFEKVKAKGSEAA